MAKSMSSGGFLRGWSAVRRSALRALALVALAGLPLHGQFAVRGEKAGTNDPQQGVYVRDSAIAADKFELGLRMERLKEWHKSADVYQEILKNYKDRVVAIKTDEKGHPVRYASVVVAVQERFARWPEEGLAVYRTRFEPEASALLEKARMNDLATLHQVFDSYFALESGKTAGMRLMDLYLENGEFSASGWIGQRLLDWHPSLGTQRGAVLYRTATAQHLAGNAVAEKKLAEEAKKKHAADRVVVAGQETPLIEAVEKVLAEPAPTPGSLAADSYPMFNADASRSGMTVGGGKASALVHSTRLAGLPTAGLPEPTRQQVQSMMNQAASQGLSTNVMPVVDRGELFFQDGFRVYAVHLESGVPLSGWAQTYSSGTMGQFVLSGVGVGTAQQIQQGSLRQSRQNCVTLTDDSVLAVMGMPELTMRNMGAAAATTGQGTGTRLVCLDRANGRPRWIVDPNTLPNNPGNAKNVSFSGSPLVAGESVYIIGRGMGGAGVEDCSVYCFELDSGKYRWACYLASAQMVNPNYGMQVMSTETASHLAFSSGRVFVSTNLGAIAAVDAYSGATAWLTIYPREESFAARRAMGAFGWQGGMQPADQNAPKPWEFNPVITSDGKVFVLPTDGKYLHILDVASGDEFKRIPREVETGLLEGSKTKLNMLLAVAGEKMFLAGSDRDGIYVFNWQTYKGMGESGRKLNYDATIWKSDMGNLRGRPFVSRDFVYVPTVKAVWPLDMRNGKAIDSYPPNTVSDWAPGEGPGNLVVTAEHVVVATGTHVNVYTDLTRVRSKYASALKADPNNVEARLVFSELMFNARQIDDAMKVLDEAIARLGGLNSLRKGPERERIFTDALMFAGRLATDKTEASVETAEQLYDRAAASANSARQQVSYRVARARFIENLKATQRRPDYAKAARLYQEILATPEWRTIPLTGDDGTTVVQAGKLAENAINELIRIDGEKVYKPFELEAAAALEAIAGADAGDRMLALADTYPNSKVAQSAMMKAAELYEQGGQPRIATQVLRRLYWKHSARMLPEKRVAVVEAMARNHLRAGNINGALGRLQRLSDEELKRALASPMLLVDKAELKGPDGQAARTLGEAQKAILSLLRDRADAFPDIGVPRRITHEQRLQGIKQPPAWAPADKQVAIAGVQALYRPQGDSGGKARADRVLAWSNGQLQCYAPGGNKPVWSVAPFAEIASNAVWHEKHVLAWNAGNLAVIDGEDGKVIWSTSLQKLGGVELVNAGIEAPAIQPEPQQEVAEGAVRIRAANRVVLNGRVVVAPGVVDANVVQPAAVPGNEALLHVRPLTDRLIVRSSTGRVAALALDSGKPIWQTRLALTNANAQTLATDDFVVVRGLQGSQSQLFALDAFNGQQLFRRSLPANQGVINMALGDDGTLVWTTTGKMEGKDLYEPSEGATWAQTGRNYGGLVRPDQLLISGQTVFAVCDQGMWIERRSLRSGEVAGNQLSTVSSNGVAPGPENPVQLRMAGSRLYALSNISVTVHHLDNSTQVNYIMNMDVNSRADDMMITQDYVIVAGGLKNRKQGVLVMAHTRDLYTDPATGKSTEMGVQTYREELPIDPAVKGWQAVAGGLYYLAADDTLKFVPGSKSR